MTDAGRRLQSLANNVGGTWRALQTAAMNRYRSPLGKVTICGGDLSLKSAVNNAVNAMATTIKISSLQFFTVLGVHSISVHPAV